VSTVQFWDAMTAAQSFNRGGVMRCGCLRPPSSDCRRLQMISRIGFRAVILWPRSGTYIQSEPTQMDNYGTRELQPLHSSYGTRTPRY
jgi:hypothetical protein